MDIVKPLYVERGSWKHRKYVTKLFDSIDISDLKPITQIQAVCFSNNDNIVLYKHVDGWNGLPGGTIEDGETFEDTLKRELDEESSLELIDWGVIGYEKNCWEDDAQNPFYFLRCWAEVKLIDKPVGDPDKKSLNRIVVRKKEAHKKLGYGKKGEIWVKLAIEKFKK